MEIIERNKLTITKKSSNIRAMIFHICSLIVMKKRLYIEKKRNYFYFLIKIILFLIKRFLNFKDAIFSDYVFYDLI